MIAIAALVVGAAMVYAPYPWLAGPSQPQFVIESGQSLSQIADSLRDGKLIISKPIFAAYVKILGQEKNLQAGKYILTKPTSISRLVYLFSHGLAEPDNIEVTIPEGSNIREIDKIFAKAGLIKPGNISSYDLQTGIAQEGYLFPDTYFFKRPQNGQYLTVSEIVNKMKNNFNVRTRNLFGGRLTGESGADGGYQLIIIASILEKEVKTEEDMRLVAGIINKRLKLGLPLQIDATLAYGLCQPKFAKGQSCDTSQADIVDNLNYDSKYNTYRYRGLPPGPISNPGLTAIKAALNPLASDYLYYLTTPDGQAIYSKTAAEHQKARNKYLNPK